MEVARRFRPLGGPRWATRPSTRTARDEDQISGTAAEAAVEELRSDLGAAAARLQGQIDAARAEPKADQLLEALDVKVSDRQLQAALAEVRQEVLGVERGVGGRLCEVGAAVCALNEEALASRGFREGLEAAGGIGGLARRLGDVEAALADLRPRPLGRPCAARAPPASPAPAPAWPARQQPCHGGGSSDLEAAFGSLRERLTRTCRMPPKGRAARPPRPRASGRGALEAASCEAARGRRSGGVRCGPAVGTPEVGRGRPQPH
ncbi:unnamed protein product [Prorocentrum cordatum]|uniref:Uncharacterized protein n=1 Tax=Prorocentrum cordatum TaxID=2364126 RepID=A0ABN9TWH5_9DINO|nr:unnamed protein product [Polarella glacialis]